MHTVFTPLLDRVAESNYVFDHDGKNPRDGVGACLKRLVRKEALKESYAPEDKPILKARDIYEWSRDETSLRTTVCLVEEANVAQARAAFELLGHASKAIPGISKCHRLTQVAVGVIECRRTGQSARGKQASVVGDAKMSRESLQVAQKILMP